MRYVQDLEVIENKILNNNYFVLKLKCPMPLPMILPGQFAEIKVDNAPNTYLRRPFSVYDVNKDENTISFLIKKIGEGSNKLSNLIHGDILNVVYPLGNGFGSLSGEKALLVGGGIGIAALLILIKKLTSEGKIVDTLFGGRSKTDIIESENFLKYGRLFISTEDGTRGEKGLVTEHSVMTRDLSEYDKIYTCGPDPMMKAVSIIAARQDIPCEASLENLMACGIGACLCCVVETTNGNKTTCVEGPVFDTRLIKSWN